MLDKWFYSYAKDIYERDKKFNKAWVKQLNKSERQENDIQVCRNLKVDLKVQKII